MDGVSPALTAERTLPGGPGRKALPARLWDLLRLVRDPLDFVGQRFATHGDTYLVEEGGGGHLFVSRDPAVLRDVLVTKASRFRKAGGANDRLRPVLGDGLLTADGEVWKRARRLIQPAFRQAAIRGYAATMVDHTERVAWEHGEVVDVSEAMMVLTLRIVCKALFDHDVAGTAGTAGETDTVAAAMEALREGTQGDLWPAWLPTPRRRRTARAIQAIDTLIERLMQELAERGLRHDLLSMLLDAGLSGRQVRDQLVTFFLAGHETTSHALTWALILLGEHPEVQAALEREVDSVLGDGPPALAHLEGLTITSQVLKEAMRLYPPAFALPRVAAEEVEVGGWPLRAGWQVVGWVWHVHRDPRWFPEPEAFRPARFAGGDPPEVYLPFGAGTRMCIGAGFASMEMRLVLASLVRRFRVRPTLPRPRPRPRVTLSPAGPVPMQVERR